MNNKSLFIVLIISILLLTFTGCSSTQSYSGGDTYTSSTFDAAMTDAVVENGGAPGVLTVAWNIIKWPVEFIFGIPKATLNAFDGMFQSADAAGVGQVTVTEGY